MSGELRAERKHANPPSEASRQPPGTLGIYEEYWDDAAGVKIGAAHYFWLPEGGPWRIGGSGVPDPKWVLWQGVMLIAGP